MNKRFAALDLGTNTFHLLIAEVINGILYKIVEEQRHVKLGEGGINKGVIAKDAFDRGVEALMFFRSVIDAYQVSAIKANGTAALRTADNGIHFIDTIKKRTGIEVEIIAGDQEAELIYQGIRAITDPEKSSLIMDIGGGSVEFIFCSREKIFWKKSYPIGAAKLMASYHHSDPISASDLHALLIHLSFELSELKAKAQEFKPAKLIGSAGAFETFAALETRYFKKTKENLETDNYSFDPYHLKAVLQQIISSSHNERAADDLILPVRTDMIVVASVLTNYILDSLQIPHIVLSRYSLKEGLLLKCAAGSSSDNYSG